MCSAVSRFTAGVHLVSVLWKAQTARGDWECCLARSRGVKPRARPCRARGAPDVSAALPGVCGEGLVGACAGIGCGVGACRRDRRAAAPGVVLGPYTWCIVPGGSLAGNSPACFCLLVPFFAFLVSTHSVRLILLLLCSVFRVLAVCCCASSCAAASNDSPRSCLKCFCACYLVDVTNTHTHTHQFIRACGRCMLWWRYLTFPFGALT